MPSKTLGITNLLALECERCNTKFRRSPSCEWARPETQRVCFDCFVRDALDGHECTLIVFSRHGTMIAESESNERLQIAARNASTRVWYALTLSGEFRAFPPGTEFVETAPYATQSR